MFRKCGPNPKSVLHLGARKRPESPQHTHRAPHLARRNSTLKIPLEPSETHSTILSKTVQVNTKKARQGVCDIYLPYRSTVVGRLARTLGTLLVLDSGGTRHDLAQLLGDHRLTRLVHVQRQLVDHLSAVLGCVLHRPHARRRLRGRALQQPRVNLCVCMWCVCVL